MEARPELFMDYLLDYLTVAEEVAIHDIRTHVKE
jgi:hypothetical protein